MHYIPINSGSIDRRLDTKSKKLITDKGIMQVIDRRNINDYGTRALHCMSCGFFLFSLCHTTSHPSPCLSSPLSFQPHYYSFSFHFFAAYSRGRVVASDVANNNTVPHRLKIWRNGKVSRDSKELLCPSALW